jgi:hypothetical protein
MEIKMMDRWKSEAFLEYIRPKLTIAFSKLSTHMTKNHLTKFIHNAPIEASHQPVRQSATKFFPDR